jgi:hypothetical protein
MRELPIHSNCAGFAFSEIGLWPSDTDLCPRQAFSRFKSALVEHHAPIPGGLIGWEHAQSPLNEDFHHWAVVKSIDPLRLDHRARCDAPVEREVSIKDASFGYGRRFRARYFAVKAELNSRSV